MASRFPLLAGLSVPVAAIFAACGGNVVLDQGGSSGAGASSSPSGGGGSITGGGGSLAVTGPSAAGGGTCPNGCGVGGAGGVGNAGPTTVTVGPSSTVSTTTVSVTSTSVGPTTATTSSGMACSSMTTPQGACSPMAACPAAGSPCLAVTSQNGAATFGLRMSQLTVSAPAALAKGIVQTTVANSMLPNIMVCNLFGSGTFNWLLQFDTNAGTLTTGGAVPIQDPFAPYSFVNAVYQQGMTAFAVQPVTLMAPFTGCAVDSSAGDVILPLYLDQTGTNVVLLPFHQLHFRNGSVSGDHSCVGYYNADTLDPANNCAPDAQHPAFTDGASIRAYIALAEADQVQISALNESLCVLLSGDATQYGMTAPGSSETICKRDANGNIVFQGDWCSMTDMAAGNGCADAVRFRATFSASGVTIQ